VLVQRVEPAGQNNAAAVAERGGRALLRCQPEMQRLLRTVRGVSGTLAPHQTAEFDFHCALLSLPRVLQTTIDTIPAQVPYIVADPLLASEWRARLRIVEGVARIANGGSVGEAAAAVGYASPSAFSAMVRRSLGKPLRELIRR